MKLLHDHKTAGHFGTDRTLFRIRRKCYWPGYKADVIRWCQRCATCESHKVTSSKFRAPLMQELKGAPMETIACDIMGPLTQTDNGNVYILVIMDYFTKWVEAFALPNHTAQTVADKLVTEWICRYGIPLHLHSDQGRDFESNLFQEMCNLLDIRKTHTTPYHPQSDGQVERFNRSLKLMLRSFVNETQDDWDDHLPFLTMAYRSSAHKSTKCTPNLLMFGRETYLPVDILLGPPTVTGEYQCHIEYVEWLRNSLNKAHEKAAKNLEHNAMVQKRLYDAKGCFRKFKIGQWVWRWYPPAHKEKFGRGWQGPFLIVAKVNDVAYRIQSSFQARPKVIHINHLKPYLPEDTPDNWLKSDPILPEAEKIDLPDQSQCNSDSAVDKSSTGLEREIFTRSKRQIKPPIRFGFDD